MQHQMNLGHERDRARRIIDAAHALEPTIAGHREPAPEHLAQVMDRAFSSTSTGRGWSDREGHEAIETAVVIHLVEHGRAIWRKARDEWDMVLRLDELDQAQVQAGGSSAEQRRHQHFSTPLGLAMVLVEAADLKSGDAVLEPSAGLGAMVALANARTPGLRWHLNEIEPVRHEILRELFPDAEHTCHDASEPVFGREAFEAVVMNPPFSRSAQANRRRRAEDTRHVAAAGQALRGTGRIACLTSRSAAPGQPEWDHLVGHDSRLTTIWSRTISDRAFRTRGIKVATRLSVVERESAYANRPWTTRDDETLDPEDAMGAVLTTLAHRYEPVPASSFT